MEQLKLQQDLIGLDSAYIDLQAARASNDLALIAQAEHDYTELLKKQKSIKWLTFKLKFWKIVAIVEGTVIIILSTGIIILLMI